MQAMSNANLLFSYSSPLFLLTLLLSGCASESARVTTTQPVSVLPTAVSLSVSPTAVLPGQSATLSWSSASAVSCTAGGAWSGTKQMSGSINVSLPSPAGKTFTLECVSASGQSVSKKATLSLSPVDGACTTSQALTANNKRNGKRRPRSGAHS